MALMNCNLKCAFVSSILKTRLTAAVIVLLAAVPFIKAQSTSEIPLKLGEVRLNGLRATASACWNVVGSEVTNLTDMDRVARVYFFYPGQTEVQFGREVWVPAHSTIKTWLLAGPPGAKPSDTSCEVLALLAEQVDGKERLFLPTKERQLLSRRILYRPPETTTAILLDEPDPEENSYGRIPRPDSPADEALQLARTMRAGAGLSEFVQVAPPGPLPSDAEAFAGIDQFILASDRLARDPVGMKSLRQWLQQGGRVWVMLDMISAETLDELLGEAIDFQVVDRSSVNTTILATLTTGQIKLDPFLRTHDRPVQLVHVVMPPGEKPVHTVNGLPASFTRQVGRGKVLFTTVGPRAWYRPRRPRAEESPYRNFPSLPFPSEALKAVTDELKPPSIEDPRRSDAYTPLLADEIGYSVIGRRVVLPVFGGLLLAGLVLGLALRNSRRSELWGWTVPVATLTAAATMLFLGENTRGAARPATAVVQIVEGGTGTEEASAHGLLAAYRPESGDAPIGAVHGGSFDLDMEGIEGQNRRLLRTDLDSWHWDNLSLPGGVRLASFRDSVAAGEPVTAVAWFGPEGLEGTIRTGKFEDVSDAVLVTAGGRSLAVRLSKDGIFHTGSADVLPSGQFVSDGILTDRQQRRQDMLRRMFQSALPGRAEGRNLLVVWAKPLDMGFTLSPGAGMTGNSLLKLPLHLEPTPPGKRVAIPGPLVSFRQISSAGPVTLTRESTQAGELRLRFQLPAEVLPMRVETARLKARIEAPSRQIVFSGQRDGTKVELHRVGSPVDVIRVDIADERLLRLDDQGGIHLSLAIGEEQAALGGQKDAREVSQKWRIEDLELEVVGTTME
jgi:hypothetical protein